ncbi:hypothetical protein DFJ73DRAFT_864624 [Zopfochytrium polystomum]|nr:hypothetical protein DFJ73DRAFT_864624 [Zopfochytrium polystomum]
MSLSSCAGAFLGLQITGSASAYLENVWVWTADHELDRSDHAQISVYTGRGLLVQNTKGNPVWMYGSSVEHNQLYNYQLSGAKNVFMGMIQTETPYYQGPTKDATTPYPVNPAYDDPTFSSCTTASCKKAWGLRVSNSSDVLVYGAGLYSFFDDYSQTCLDTKSCQDNMVSIENSQRVSLFGLSTIGVKNMVSVDGDNNYIPQSDNTNTFASTIVSFTL